MQRPSYAYPPALKTVLKCGPVITVMIGFGLIFQDALYNVIAHPHDHVQKFHFRHKKFDRVVRSRDEKLRNYFWDDLNWQPNLPPAISPNREVVRN